MKSVVDLVDYLISFSFFSCCSQPPDKIVQPVQISEPHFTDYVDPESGDDISPIPQESAEVLDELDELATLQTPTDDEVSTTLVDNEDASTIVEPAPTLEPVSRHLKGAAIRARRQKRMESHLRKVNYTGAVGAPPPYELHEIIAPLIAKLPSNTTLEGGIYLAYSLSGNGSLLRIYSQSEPKVDQDTVVIAYSMPKKMISSFKYEKGSELLISNLGKVLTSDFVNDRKSFYTAWMEYIKGARSYNSTMYLLPEFTVSPPPRVQIICIQKGDKTISELPTDTPIVLSEYDVISALPPGVGGVKIGTTTRSQLVNLATKFGALVEF